VRETPTDEAARWRSLWRTAHGDAERPAEPAPAATALHETTGDATGPAPHKRRRRRRGGRKRRNAALGALASGGDVSVDDGAEAPKASASEPNDSSPADDGGPK